jgi:hypothetical protein
MMYHVYTISVRFALDTVHADYISLERAVVDKTMVERVTLHYGLYYIDTLGNIDMLENTTLAFDVLV